MSQAAYLLVIIGLVGALMFSVFTSSQTFVCYDGSVQSSKGDCPLPNLPVINEIRAERGAESYGRALSEAHSLRYSGITVFRDGANWYQDAIFSSRSDDEVYEATLFINGTSGRVTCFEGCTFVEDDVAGNVSLNESNI